MKNLLKNKKLIIGSAVLLILVLITGIVLIFSNRVKSNKDENSKETIYTMYVKINPLVKLVFKEVEYKCDEPLGYCTILEGIVDYELLNDDAKGIYKNLDLKDKSVYDVVGLLCKIARDNNIAFESINITTDYNFDYEDFKKEMQNNSKYEFNYEVNIDIKDLLNEQEIINEDIESNPDIKSYTITFDSTGGNDITKQVVKENDKVVKPNDPTRNGYIFVEWQLNGKKYDFNSEVTKDIILKAKWKKDTNSNKPSENSKPNPESNNNTNNKPSTDTETKPETPTKTKSTPDNINLNDNILVEEPCSDCINGSTFVFSDNITTLLAEFKSEYDNHSFSPPGFGSENPCNDYLLDGGYTTPEYDACDTEYQKELERKRKDFYNTVNQLTYNSSKATKAKNEMINYLNNQKGIINIKINDDPKDFKYSYDFLHVSYENVGLDDFTSAFNDKYNNIRDEIDNIFYRNGGYIIEGGGSGEEGEPVLLDEALCKKYNLTCSRW